MTFLHKIEEGPADKSYGIHVAKIAGLPVDLLERADSILTHLESQDKQVVSQQKATTEQISLFEAPQSSTVLEELRNLDIYNMTPLEVMGAVSEMKKKL